MAKDQNPEKDKNPEVEMPDVGPVPKRSAGKWATWFIIIVAIIMIVFFLV